MKNKFEGRFGGVKILIAIPNEILAKSIAEVLGYAVIVISSDFTPGQEQEFDLVVLSDLFSHLPVTKLDKVIVFAEFGKRGYTPDQGWDDLILQIPNYLAS